MTEAVRNEAILYYLYMLVDGEVSYSEEKLFNEICKGLLINDSEKEDIISQCQMMDEKSVEEFLALIDNFKEKIAQPTDDNKIVQSDRVRIIWNLINLGYADSAYSENEKIIVGHLVEEWKIKGEIFQEMLDVAETLLALEKKREWVYSSFPKGKERDEMEKRIDVDVEKMITDIKITLEEMNM